MKRTFSIYPGIVMVFVLFLTTNCKKEPDPLGISTLPVSDITGKEAASGGNIFSGIADSYGVCWGLQGSPTIGDSFTSDGAGNGVFHSTLAGLKPASLYYIRAYATNTSGITYGDEISFSTVGHKPTVKTRFPSYVTRTSAVLTGTVNCNYLKTYVYFDYGYDTNYGMTVEAQDNPKNGHDEISVFAGVSGITELKTCHFRIRAENELGTSYGDDVVFAMDGTMGNVTDYDGNVYNTMVVNTQTWIAENLRGVHLNDGTMIPNQTDPVKFEEAVTPCYIWINNDTLTKLTGGLYNWYTVETGKICPEGWHVPDREEWNLLGSSDFMKLFPELSQQSLWIFDHTYFSWWASYLQTGGAWITAGSILIFRDPYRIVHNPNYRERSFFIRCLKDEIDSAK